MIIKISDIEIGEVTKPIFYDYKKRERVEIDPYQYFLDNNKIKDVKNTNIKYNNAYHKNYLEYLEKCWGDHQVAVVSPEILWYIFLCELASIVKKNSSSYKSLFSTSGKQKEISVQYDGDPTLLPLNRIISELKQIIPTQSHLFFPRFSTSTINSDFAFNTAFADMCSPYYSYSMYLCGIPAIDLRGSKEDWLLASEYAKALCKIFPEYNDYIVKIALMFLMIANHNIQNRNTTFKNMFNLKKCGSGSQVEVDGWITDIFLEIPAIKFVGNYPTNISIVNYKNLSTNKKYRMLCGLFSSSLVDGVLEPQFGHIVTEIE